MKIKVMRIIARLNVGGPALHTIILNEGLKNNEFDTILVTGRPQKDEGDMAYLAKDKGLNVTIIPELGRNIKLWSDVIALWKLFKIIKKEKPDIVHTHTAKAGTLGRCAAIIGGVPIRIHSFHGHVFHDYFNPVITNIFISIERMFACFTDQIVVVSETVKRDICDNFRIANRQKVSVIRLGLDLEKFKNIDKAKGIIRKELNISKDVLLVGIVGRLTAIKNHKLFFDAIKLLKGETPRINARFLIVGDGELRDYLEGYANSLGIKELVHFMGWRRDLPNVYADLDIVALTSLNEGTPLSLIEAMAAQRAVVATEVGGVADLVEDKKTGWLIKSDDPVRLKEAIAALLNDAALREKMGKAASLQVYEKYSKERLVKDMEGLYKALLTEKNIIRSRDLNGIKKEKII